MRPRPGRSRLDEPALDPAFEEEEADLDAQAAEDEQVGRLQAALGDRRRIVGAVLFVVLAVIAIYVLFPRLVGIDEALARIDDADWYWVVVAIAFNVIAFAAYVALFRGILGGSRNDDVRRRLDVRASYQITMAGLAATRIFSAAGAGGIVLTYWALRKAGMPRRRSACRMVAFLVLMYSVYTLALIVFGVLLRTGVLPGDDPLGGTVIPAAVAAGLMIVFAFVALIPQDMERRMQSFAGGYRRTRYLTRLAKGPATVASGVRTAIDYVRHPSRGALAVVGAVGFWAANIGVLWASFEAFGGHPTFGVLVQGFFVGLAANLIPSPAGGVGSVDAGLIGAFVLFGMPSSVVFPAVLTYRVIAFWLPIPPGIVAFFQLRSTVAAWERERADGVPAGDYTSKSKVRAEAS
jgi:putative heme transporter